MFRIQRAHRVGSPWRSCAGIWFGCALGLGLACSAERESDPRPHHGGTGAGDAEGLGSGPTGSGGTGECLCPAPLADCNGDAADGCEADTASSLATCGGCSPCEQVGDPEADHGEVLCFEGQCKMFCDDDYAEGPGCWEIPSWKDCDGVAANGCEVDVLESEEHCGTCGNTCPAGTPCFEGQCGCPDGYVVCGDTCANLDTDADHCGACDLPCPDPDEDDDQVPTCKGGVCGTGCNEKCGEFDCDNDPSTPCVWLDDPEHCGACNNACASGVCIAGGAVPPHCCDESAVQDDVYNCGACGHDCTEDVFEQTGDWWSVTVACVAGACVIECAVPLGDCDGDPGNGCETDLEKSTSDCGGCGNACAEGELCVYGTCASTCESPR